MHKKFCFAVCLAGLGLTAPAFAGSASAALYRTQPNADKCQAGVLTAAARQEALDTLNRIRALHGLNAVSYDASKDNEVMQASLMIAASHTINHAPRPSTKCYTQAGAAGSKTSNLFGGLSFGQDFSQTPARNIIGWLIDKNSLDGSIGHRRWLLNPFLKTIAYGHVDDGKYGGAAIKVIWETDAKRHVDTGNGSYMIENAVSSNLPANSIIAYPYHNYPKAYFDKNAPLSLGILADSQSEYWNRKVNFSRARLSVTERNTGRTLRPTAIHFDKQNYGLANNFQFRLPGLRENQINI